MTAGNLKGSLLWLDAFPHWFNTHSSLASYWEKCL
jgi:hypothetical protein